MIASQVVALEQVCAKHGTDLITASLQFPLMHPAVTSVRRKTAALIVTATRWRRCPRSCLPLACHLPGFSPVNSETATVVAGPCALTFGNHSICYPCVFEHQRRTHQRPQVVCGVRSAAEATTNVGMLETAVPADLWRSLLEAGLLPSDLPLINPDTGVDVSAGGGERASL